MYSIRLDCASAYVDVDLPAKCFSFYGDPAPSPQSKEVDGRITDDGKFGVLNLMYLMIYGDGQGKVRCQASGSRFDEGSLGCVTEYLYGAGLGALPKRHVVEGLCASLCLCALCTPFQLGQLMFCLHWDFEELENGLIWPNRHSPVTLSIILIVRPALISPEFVHHPLIIAKISRIMSNHNPQQRSFKSDGLSVADSN